jgi:hypothetical protein
MEIPLIDQSDLRVACDTVKPTINTIDKTKFIAGADFTYYCGGNPLTRPIVGPFQPATTQSNQYPAFVEPWDSATSPR